LYIPRALGGGNLLSIEDSIVGEEQNLNAYLLCTSEPFLQLVNSFFTLSSSLFGNGYKETVIRNHQELYLSKLLHGQFMCEIGNEYDCKFQWSWLCQGNLDKETEGFIMAAQEQVLTTNIIKNRIYHLSYLFFVSYVILVMRQWTI